jgi:hypothetical protein
LQCGSFAVQRRITNGDIDRVWVVLVDEHKPDHVACPECKGKGKQPKATKGGKK